MKQFLLLVTLIATTIASAQEIVPVQTGEFCPNQEYTFTVSSLPGNYTGINTSGGATITQSPTGNGTSISFKGKFSDVSGTQTFEISYQGGSKPFKFTKVKSLFGGYKVGSAPSPITAPICVTTPIALNIAGDQYWDTSTNPYSSFGSINTYRYLIPSGWYLNSTLSNGSTWITASGSVTLTPTTNTGNGSDIQYIAKSDCSGGFFEGNPRYISISRPNPTFTLLPTSLIFECGIPQTKTFTVSTSNTLSCPVSYTWNLGSNNGWLYNGKPAPASFTTTTSSITLTSANGNVLPSAVNVTPILNGNNLSQLSSTTSFTPFTSTSTITGLTTLCSSVNYGISNLLPEQTVSWSIQGRPVATLSDTSGATTTLTKFGNGTLNLIATLTNACGQTFTLPPKTIFIGLLPAPTTIMGPTSVQSGALVNYQTSPVPGATSYEWWLPYPYETVEQFDYFGQNWQKLTSSTDSSIQVFTGYAGTAGYVQVMAVNACGVGGASSISVAHGGSGGAIPRLSNIFIIYPNPSNDIVNIEIRDKKSKYKKEVKISAELFDMMGQSKLIVEITNNKAKFSVTDLNKGIYVLKIYINDQVESHQLMVE